MQSMRFRSQLILCLISSTCLLIITALASQYTVGSMLKATDTPFGLSYHYLEYKTDQSPEERLSADQLLDLQQDTDVTIISLDETEGVMGLYDPRMYYGGVAAAIGLYGNYRYFSMDDYREHTDAYIKVRHTADDGSSIYIYADKNPYVKGRIELLQIGPSALLYDSRVDEIDNLTALSNLGSSLWLDADDPAQLNTLSQKLEASGYRRQPAATADLGTWFTALGQTFRQARSASLLTLALAFNLLFILMMLVLWQSNQKLLYLHKQNGGRGFSSFRTLVWPYLIGQLLAFLPALAFYGLLRQQDLWPVFGLADFLLVCCLQQLAIFLWLLLSFMLVWKRMKHQGAKA
ncbi:MAG: hypothetical protein PHR21_03785 [Oscillospiraceae bacterium]|nr:hypothetical protein [Oscillospiraceae bacterium]